ncbi:GNAT family N-acetyltransferase [Erythrobacter mangrovi]|uniref:GNAT family N-acetyltransferase n=1 Tax=Erythrobacter mangrovi TaxID=2739433 RepID=A0A7D3XBL5_9SPHN|nr:GNAT family N-acetyltransferase [Erythrobacter mangrovi]QKG72555.1 GNAT family N-acetyltransferase [Erythrobacter mangrovi]
MIETERLLLRRWKDSDLAPFSEMGQDPEVMRHFPKLLSREECEVMIRDRFEAHFDRHGFGLWAVERTDDHSFIGFVGLGHVAFACPIEGQVEIGWRLARSAWGHGFAYEAASAAMKFGFGVLELGSIVAMTVTGNERSQHLMGKLGMTRAPELDFDHPWIEEGHLVRPQIVYRKEAPAR